MPEIADLVSERSGKPTVNDKSSFVTAFDHVVQSELLRPKSLGLPTWNHILATVRSHISDTYKTKWKSISGTFVLRLSLVYLYYLGLAASQVSHPEFGPTVRYAKVASMLMVLRETSVDIPTSVISRNFD